MGGNLIFGDFRLQLVIFAVVCSAPRGLIAFSDSQEFLRTCPHKILYASFRQILLENPRTDLAKTGS